MAAPAAANPVHESAVEVALDLLTNPLKDPDSARYRRTFLSEWTAGRFALCGEVNAKNSYGGYVGYRRFYAGDDVSAVEIESDTQNYFIGRYNTFCSNKVTDVKLPAPR